MLNATLDSFKLERYDFVDVEIAVFIPYRNSYASINLKRAIKLSLSSTNTYEVTAKIVLYRVDFTDENNDASKHREDDEK